jgi:hypothetical protein
MIDKCVFGVVITGVILTLLVGPLYFFSDIGGFVAPNPITSAAVSYSFLLMRNGTTNAHIQNDSFKTPYLLYSNSNPYLRKYDKDEFETSEFQDWTETRFFAKDQLQDCVLSEYSED